jgi:hypothetical protein
MALTSDANLDPGIDHPGLLRAVRALACTHLDTHWEAVLARADDYLFDAGLHDAPNGELTALRDLRRARAVMRERFQAASAAAFDELCNGIPAGDDRRGELQLLADDALEEQLSSEQMVESLLRRHAGSLELIEQRMAVLAERATLEGNDNPISPARLGETMRVTLQDVSVSTAVRITIYKLAEREFGDALSTLYNRVNAMLAEAGILPRLLPVLSEPAAPPAAGATPPAAGQAQSDNPDWPEREAPAPGDQALFSRLLELMGGWRRREPAGHEGAAGASSTAFAGGDDPTLCLGNTDVMSVLTLLQAEPPSSLEKALDDERVPLAERLRGELLMRARGMGLGEGRPVLAPEHEDAINLVGMLFEVLLDERDFEGDIRRKLSRMLVPFVRVAVRDRRLFVHKAHPARRYLNAVVEACDGNHGEVPQERALLQQVEASITRLVAEYNEDVAIFETLEEELRAYMAQMRQRIELAERRAAEAQSGRERLEQARAEAHDDIAGRRHARQLPAVVDEFLRGHAAHHLTQVALRDGRGTPAYQAAVTLIERMLSDCEAALLQPGTEPSWDEGTLRVMMQSSGSFGEAADEAVAALRAASTHAATSAVETPFPAAAPAPESVPAPAAAPAPASAIDEPLLRVVGGRDTLDYDPAMADSIRALPIGSWMQLLPESGRGEPVKLAWISPVSSRLLLVNRRGIRLLVASPEELAAMVEAGRLQLRQGDTPFEDVLHRMVDRLQSAVS